MLHRLLNTDDSSGPMEGDDATVRYLFNQEERHETFWKYVREKNWEAVESFLEKKVVCFLFYGNITISVCCIFSKSYISQEAARLGFFKKNF